MAINVLDVRDTFAAPRVRVPALRLVATASTTSARRLPVTVLAAGLIGILEAIGLLAVAVSGIDGVLTTARPTGWTLALGLTVLAAWVVLCAGSGAGLIEGTGRRLLVGLAYARDRPGRAPAGGRHRRSRSFTPPAGLPLPVLALLVLAVPVAKLLLAATPSARQWVADGPRTRAPRPDPVAAHRAAGHRDPRRSSGSRWAPSRCSAPVQAPDGGPGAAASSVVYTND